MQYALHKAQDFKLELHIVFSAKHLYFRKIVPESVAQQVRIIVR